jgi:hydrogenase maturation protease
MMKDERLINITTTTPVARPSSILVIGLGNPILGDDGVGWKVAQKVQEHLGVDPHFHICHHPGDNKDIHRDSPVEVDCVSLGGLSLMERMLGYKRVILIDSMETGQGPAGRVQVLPLDSLTDPMAGHSASTHDTTLMTALNTAKLMGLPIPSSVEIVAIEAMNVYDFSEELTPPVANALPIAVQAVLDLLSKEEP